jgi:hypothetical protein
MAADGTVFPDVDKRTESKGSAATTPGLTSLDQQREASLADEGGAAGAVVDGERANTVSGDEDAEDAEPGAIGLEGLVIAAGLLGAAAFLLWRAR